MKLTWLLLTLIFSNQIFATADDINVNTPYKHLVINPVTSEIQLTDIERRMINKIVLKACAKQTGFQISLGSIGIAREAILHIFQVNLALTGTEQNLKISGNLIDEKNKILIKKVVFEKNERLHLMRNVEKVMEQLFPKASSPQLIK